MNQTENVTVRPTNWLKCGRTSSINPTANIRLAAGRKLLPKNGADAFTGGASATITGNMLTTSGSSIQDDINMLHEMGFNLGR